MDQLFAEDLPYWQTGRSQPDYWMELTRKVLTDLGGEVVAEAFAQDAVGRAVYMMAWRIGGDNFRVDWPVLQSRKGKLAATRIQAATMLYHHVKAAAVSAAVLGARRAFMAFLVLPDGKVAGNVGNDTLARLLPDLRGGPLMLGEGR